MNDAFERRNEDVLVLVLEHPSEEDGGVFG